MIRKIIALYVACFSLNTLNMEPTVNQEEQYAKAVSHVTSLIDKNFSTDDNIDNHYKCYFEAFVKDLNNTRQTNAGIYPLLHTENMQQHIVTTITDKMYRHDLKNNRYVAQQLATYDDSFKTVSTRIEDAFDPSRCTHSAWYANATKMFPKATGGTAEHYGYDGGIMTPLSLAAKQAHFNWFGRLLTEGANPNKTYPSLNYGTMHILCEVIYLKEHLRRNFHPRIVSTYYGDLGTYAHQLYLNRPELYKNTKSAYCNIICLLLKNKVDITLGSSPCTTGSHNLTPLMWAIMAKDTKIALALLKAGAQLSDADGEHLEKDNLEWFFRIKMQ